jgi:hypothetical protein
LFVSLTAPMAFAAEMRELEKQKKAQLRQYHLAAVQPFVNVIKASVRHGINENTDPGNSAVFDFIIVDDFDEMTGEQIAAVKAILEEDEGLFVSIVSSIYRGREKWHVHWKK